MEGDRAAMPHAGDQGDPVAELEVRTSMPGDLSVSSHGAGAQLRWPSRVVEKGCREPTRRWVLKEDRAGAVQKGREG